MAACLHGIPTAPGAPAWRSATAGLLAALLTIPLATALGGCGGGARTIGGGEQTELLLPSVAAEDGVVENDREVRTNGVLPQVGDLGSESPGRECRQFFSFDLGSVPPGSIVTSAVLRLDQFVVVGTPYGALGSVVVDHLVYDALDADDFASRALREGLGPLSSDATLGARSLDVTEAVAQDVALGRPRSQFRLRFAPAGSDGDGQNDFASFAEAEAATAGGGQPPRLIVLVRAAP